MQSQLYPVQGVSTGKISIVARPCGGDWLFDEIKALHASGVTVLVSLLTAEEVHEFDLAEEAAFCHQQAITYFSFAIADRSVPPFSEPTFLFLKQLQAFLSKGQHLAFHCRQGLGRAGLMAASVLVLTGISPEHAFDRLSQARGYPVPETEEQRAWVVALSQREKASRQTSMCVNAFKEGTPHP